jgi:hypothetical protein
MLGEDVDAPAADALQPAGDGRRRSRRGGPDEPADGATLSIHNCTLMVRPDFLEARAAAEDRILGPMSGQFCQGCGEGDLVRDPEGKGRVPVRCDLCGWTVDRESLPSEWLEEDVAVPWTKRARKAAGTLFFLWIEVDSKVPDVEFEVMRVLGLRGMSGGPRILVELETKPPAETLARLAALKGLTRVHLVP